MAEVQMLLREAAIKSAAHLQLEVSDRVSISGIAASTGIPRAEVSRFLRNPTRLSGSKITTPRLSTNRILAGWYQDPKFTDSSGKPADLKLYGRGATFEALAKKYGLGIPTRAIFDELLRAQAIELVGFQKIRAKGPIAIQRGMSESFMEAFGERASELLSTMLQNMKHPTTPGFIANISEKAIPASALPLFRKVVSTRAAEFLAEMQETSSKSQRLKKAAQRDDVASVSLTVFCYENMDKKAIVHSNRNKRRNFRRKV